MKKTIAFLLVVFMLTVSLTSCRTSARKHIRPLFSHESAVTMEIQNFYRTTYLPIFS